jgi:hypothetical protein
MVDSTSYTASRTTYASDHDSGPTLERWIPSTSRTTLLQ